MRVSSGYTLYIPQVNNQNENYVLPDRRASLLRNKVRFHKRTVYKTGAREELRKELMASFSLSPTTSRILSSRTPTEIWRIEETIRAVIDCLLLFDTRLFDTKDEYSSKLMKHLVRKILIVGAYGTLHITKMWKEFSNFVFIRGSHGETIEDPEVSRGNLFKCLFSWPRIASLIRGEEMSRRDMTSFAHLISTRGFPPPEKKSQENSLRKFIETTQRPFEASSRHLKELRNAAIKIGRKCRKAGPGPLSAAHISMACAGSLLKTTSEGGRAVEIREAIKPILTFVPEEDECLETPLWYLRCPKGEPRWRHWCRENPYYTYQEVAWGDLKPDTLAGREVFRQGFDEALGSQILSAAYLCYKQERESGAIKDGIPTRVLAVPEPGGKNRIVTTGPWWNQVLQQGIAHVTRAFLGAHPSATAGLERGDQAWQFLFMIDRVGQKLGYVYDTVQNFYCLSSDLEEATDGIPRKVALQLYEGFLEGLGYNSGLSNIVGDLIETDRVAILPNGRREILTRGVLMGEPLTKTILTLLNLACEEIAIRSYLTIPWDAPVRKIPWRCFAVAGDDHIAFGPKDYLMEITCAHICSGSTISKQKHSISNYIVRYCEKLLFVHNMKSEFNVHTVNHNVGEYIVSPFIESIKVRLLSPCSKTIEIHNDRNSAIGKARILSKNLTWFHREFFSARWLSMVRDRFVSRMGPFMPPRTSGVFWHLMLPKGFGGLGLGLFEEADIILNRIPAPSREFVCEVLRGTATEEKKSLFDGFTKNMTYRGYELEKSELQLAEEMVINFILPMLERKEFKELYVSKISSCTISEILYKRDLRKQGYLTRDEILDKILRGFLFRDLIAGKLKPKVFRTESLIRRYAKLWDRAWDSSYPPLEVEELTKNWLIRDQPDWFNVADTAMSIEVEGTFREVTLVEEATIGLPVLSIKWEELGYLS